MLKSAEKFAVSVLVIFIQLINCKVVILNEFKIYTSLNPESAWFIVFNKNLHFLFSQFELDGVFLRQIPMQVSNKIN